MLKLDGARKCQPLVGICHLPSANCQLPTANCHLPTANCLDGDMDYISSRGLVKRTEAGRKKNK